MSWVDFDASNDEGWGRRGDREYRDVRPDEEESSDARIEQAGVPPLKIETEREHCEHDRDEDVESDVGQRSRIDRHSASASLFSLDLFSLRRPSAQRLRDPFDEEHTSCECGGASRDSPGPQDQDADHDDERDRDLVRRRMLQAEDARLPEPDQQGHRVSYSRVTRRPRNHVGRSVRDF